MTDGLAWPAMFGLNLAERTMSNSTQNHSSVHHLRVLLMTALLGLKACFAGLMLLLLDIGLLLKSALQYVASKIVGIRQSVHVSQWRGIPSVLTISAADNLDFNFWRKPTYLLPTLSAMVKFKVRKLLDDRRVDILPDDKLYHWLSATPLSRLVTEEGDYLCLDLAVVQSLQTDADVYYTGPKLRIHRHNHTDAQICFKDDPKVYTPADGSLWDLAKLHLQASSAFVMPGRFHGNIHFGLPCVAAASLQVLSHDDALYQLLAPHLRFTLRINNEALRVQRAQDRSKPYAPFPVSGDEFVNSIAGDVQEQLLNPGFRCPPWSLRNADLAFNQHGQAYYDVVYAFITRVYPKLNASSLRTYKQQVALFIPGFAEADDIHALATLIWQVSFLHSADHYAMEHIMQGDQYVFFSMHLPTPSQSLIKAETPRAQLVQMACDAEDKYRSSVFCRTFVAGHKHPLWANTMDNIRYRFQDDALKQAAKDFQQQLLVTEQQLQRQGIHICPLAHTFQSICW